MSRQGFSPCMHTRHVHHHRLVFERGFHVCYDEVASTYSATRFPFSLRYKRQNLNNVTGLNPAVGVKPSCDTYTADIVPVPSTKITVFFYRQVKMFVEWLPR